MNKSNQYSLLVKKYDDNDSEGELCINNSSTSAVTGKINTRTARIEKALRKAEAVKADREARVMHHAAISAVKKAKSKQAKADRLKIKAEMAQHAADLASANAVELNIRATELQKISSKKIAEVRSAVKKLRNAERLKVQAEKQASRQQKTKKLIRNKSMKDKQMKKKGPLSQDELLVS